MPAKFNLYSAWMDPYFYVWAAVLAAALFAMVYSIRRYLELKNASVFEEAGEDEIGNPFVEAEQTASRALEAEQPELPGARPEPQDEERDEPQPEPQAPAEAPAPAKPEPVPSPAAAPREPNRAESFVHGIYAGISDLDERMKGIEAVLLKNHVNKDFTVKFLEDILQDIDSLDKSKIKVRIEYLLSDLKK